MRFEKAIAGIAMALAVAGASAAEAVVYTMTNETDMNRVIAFALRPRGKLVELGRFETGGTGTGGGLGNQSALALDASDRWMFVVNPGDGSLTSFRLQPEGLQFVSRVPSGGFSPVSVTVFGTLVYVLNEGDPGDPAGSPDNISGFRFDTGGVLVPIPDSTRPLSQPLTDPAQIGFNKSGSVLLITEKATNALTTYVVQPDGTPAPTSLTRPSAVPTPFGFEFGDRDFVFVTEANGGGRGVVAVYRIDRATGAVSDLVDRIDLGNATCWTVLNNDQTIGYATNTGSGTVSIYRIGFGGTVDPFFKRRPNRHVAAGSRPLDAVLSQNNQHFFTLNAGNGEIRSFRVERSGALKRQAGVAVPVSSSGLLAR